MNKSKKRMLVTLASLLLVGSTSMVVSAKMFGKSYDSSHDYSCCVGNSLYVFHYYQTQFFWINTGSGYEQELIGTGNCQYQCPPKNEME